MSSIKVTYELGRCGSKWVVWEVTDGYMLEFFSSEDRAEAVAVLHDLVS